MRTVFLKLFVEQGIGRTDGRIKRRLHLNEFLIDHYVNMILINASKVWFICIVHTNISINGKKKTVSLYKTDHVER